jgi:hypothetical protein
MRHFSRYESEHPTVIRIPSTSLFAANPAAEVRVCRFNSGSPRCSNGSKSPRGAETFTSPEDASFRASRVVELTVIGNVVLPRDAEVSAQPQGPWSPLFGETPA